MNQRNIIIGDSINIINTFQTKTRSDKNRLLHTQKKNIMKLIYYFSITFCKYNEKQTSNHHNFCYLKGIIILMCFIIEKRQNTNGSNDKHWQTYNYAVIQIKFFFFCKKKLQYLIMLLFNLLLFLFASKFATIFYFICQTLHHVLSIELKSL